MVAIENDRLVYGNLFIGKVTYINDEEKGNDRIEKKKIC